MDLVIVESPTKAKTIGKFLKGEFVVESSYGHIRDLPKSNKNAIDVKGGFIPNYVIPEKKKEVVARLELAAKKAKKVILATDPDREGEAIAWHLAQLLKLPKSKTSRVVFHEITKEAVEDAFNHPRAIDENLKIAQEARRVLDRLVGYDLSGLIWKKVRYGLSAGRVQSPALRILVEREREIKAFVPEAFWVLTATTKTKKGSALLLTASEEPKTEDRVKEIEEYANKNPWSVKEVKETTAKRSPNAPFTTSTLQQRASTMLGFSPARTMRAAQKLYEAGHITYMRTDSTNMSVNAQEQILAYVKDSFGPDYAMSRVYKTKAKLAQEAHEAIRPTKVALLSPKIASDEKRLYELIWRRAVTSQMADAELMRTKIIAGVNHEKVPDFAALGSRIKFDGWLKADPLSRGEETELPKVEAGEPLTLEKLDHEEKSTQPPPRYTEAGLIKELEKRGIGRPSTYASIISTLEYREYVTKDGRSLKPTDVGEVVSGFLEKNFGEYISDTFTAEMENELDEIAEGKRDYKKTLSDFYNPFHKMVKARDKETGKLTTLGDAPEEHKCPKCGGKMIIKLGKGGTFLSCARYPDCDGALTLEGKIVEGPKELGIDPTTGEPIFVLSGRFGPYVQRGEGKGKGLKRASIPKEKEPSTVTMEDALVYLSLPRTLGVHPKTGKDIVASIGRFGPFVVHDGDFRSLKTDSVYTITLERALEIFAEPKKTRKKRGEKK